MLEALIKTLLASALIAFFLITCLIEINESVTNSLIDAQHAAMINDLINESFEEPSNNGFRLVKGKGSFLVCEPRLINNYAGRVCVAS